MNNPVRAEWNDKYVSRFIQLAGGDQSWVGLATSAAESSDDQYVDGMTPQEAAEAEVDLWCSE